jgi:hypothetical protein
MRLLTCLLAFLGLFQALVVAVPTLQRRGEWLECTSSRHRLINWFSPESCDITPSDQPEFSAMALQSSHARARCDSDHDNDYGASSRCESEVSMFSPHGFRTLIHLPSDAFQSLLHEK